MRRWLLVVGLLVVCVGVVLAFLGSFTRVSELYDGFRVSFDRVVSVDDSVSYSNIYVVSLNGSGANVVDMVVVYDRVVKDLGGVR